jgi:hypothetical protein
MGQGVRFLYVVMTTGSLVPTPVMTVTGDIYSPAWIDDDRIPYVIAPIGADEQVIAQSTSSITNSQVIWPVPR